MDHQFVAPPKDAADEHNLKEMTGLLASVLKGIPCLILVY